LAWTIEYNDTAKRQLKKLDRQVAKRIADFLDHRLAVMENPRKIGQALSGALSEYWRYRVGDYRILCDIQDSRLVVLVIEVGHRGDVYR
jgi:mRNA interferase RelE/StbE